MLTDLTALEQRVVEAARRGTWAEGAGGLSVEELAVTEDQDLWVRAELIRELLLGRHGELDLHGVRIQTVRVVDLLDLDHITTTIPLHLHACAICEPVTCRDARLRELSLFQSTLTGLYAEHLRVDSNLFLRDATVHGSGDDGAVRLYGAHIGGTAEFDRAEVLNDSGPGLNAEILRMDNNLLLRDATVRGSGELGAVYLYGAHIGGSAGFDRAEVLNDSGPGLNAENLHANGILFLRGATVRGSGDDGAVRLYGAHIGGELSVHDARVGNTSGPLLVLTEAHVAKALVFPASVVCSHGGVKTGRRRCAAGTRQVSVQRLQFARLQDVSWRQWLHLLVHHTSHYVPQPFQQLAAVERAAGHDANAREVLITQQNELLRRTPEALGGWWGQRRHRLWGWLGRYGYRAQRLVVALAVILTLAGVTAYLAGQAPTRPGHHAAERVRPAAAPPDAEGTACSTVELVGLGLDRGLPVGATGLRARCDLDTATKQGQVFTVLLWMLQAALWALATLTVAAYTGMIRKPT
jgi:hypothetical protein